MNTAEELRHYAGRTPEQLRYAYVPKDALIGAAVEVEHLTILLRVAARMSPNVKAYLTRHYPELSESR